MAIYSFPPNDELYGRQWYLPLMQVPQAWTLLRNLNRDLTYGNPDLVIGVLDNGLPSLLVNNEWVCTHGDFTDKVSNGKNKIHSFYDFIADQANNQTVLNHHGLCCAGLAAGAIKALSKNGMVGVAPDCRLMGLRRLDQEIESYTADAFAKQILKVAGFLPPGGDTSSTDYENYLYDDTKAAHIISMSFTYKYGGDSFDDLHQGLLKAFDVIRRKGRNGKGTIIINAASNANPSMAITSVNSIPRYAQDCITVGASTLNSAGQEVAAPYSNYSDELIEVDVCAPSSSQNENIVHNPRLGLTGVHTATFPGQGNIPGNPDHINNFGGNSASAPMVAGVTALVLTANPQLTSAEVNEIIRMSAVRIDINTTVPNAEWYINGTTPGGRPRMYSKVMGYGRVNAEKAVQLAIDRLS